MENKNIETIVNKHPDEWIKFCNGLDDLSCSESPLFAELYDFFLGNGEMPIGVAKARTGDPDQWIADRLERWEIQKNRK